MLFWLLILYQQIGKTAYPSQLFCPVRYVLFILILYEHIGFNKNITYISVIIIVSYFFLPMNSSHAKRTLAFNNDKEEIEEDSTTPFISNEKRKKTRYCE
jgi:hypothetical protein